VRTALLALAEHYPCTERRKFAHLPENLAGGAALFGITFDWAGGYVCRITLFSPFLLREEDTTG
jgi:hypothetical protein